MEETRRRRHVAPWLERGPSRGAGFGAGAAARRWSRRADRERQAWRRRL